MQARIKLEALEKYTTGAAIAILDCVVFVQAFLSAFSL